LRTALSKAGFAACVLAANSVAAFAIEVKNTVVVTNPASLGSDDIIMDGGTLLFNASGTLENNVGFFGGKSSTIAAAAGQIIEFGPSFLGTFVGIDDARTAIFGSATATGTVLLNTDFASAHPDSHVVVAGGTLGGGFALTSLLATAASTTVNSGATLDFGAGIGYVHNLKGSGSVITNGDLGLLVDESSSSNFAGVISGSGQVSTVNMGFSNATMILSGDNTYTGGTYICACTALVLGNGGTSGSIVGNVTNGGTLAFNRSDIYVFTGVIEDDSFDVGNVVQAGTGTTVLTANNTYTGSTIVAAGKLVVNGSIAGSITSVFGGATIGGTGTLGDTEVFSGGTHAPGNSIGTQTVIGPYLLSSRANLEIEIDPASSDRVVVQGSVGLTRSVLHVIAAGGTYAASTDYLIIDNDGADAVTGAFGTITSNFVFYTPSVSYVGGDGNDVVLTFARSALTFDDVAETSNQRKAAAALDQLQPTDPLYLTLLNQSGTGARAAYDALSGDVHASLSGLLIQDSHQLRNALSARLGQAFHAGNGGGAGFALASGGPVTVADIGTGRMALGAGSGLDERVSAAPARERGLAFWTLGYGSWGDFGSDGNAGGFERKLGGFVSGMDAALGGTWRAGLATGYAQSNSSFGSRHASIDVDSVHLAAYAGGALGPVLIRSGAAWTWNEIDSVRAIAFPGFLERAEASYNGDTGQIFGEAAFPLATGRLAVEPFAGLAYVYTETDSFTETGSTAALRSNGADDGVTFSTLGFRTAVALDEGAYPVTARVSFAWRHAFDATAPGLALSFVSTGAGFGVNGLPVAEDSALIEAGLDIGLGTGASLGISYTGQIAGDVEDHGLTGSLLWQF
jgi:outer membrane autotransporter protein